MGAIVSKELVSPFDAFGNWKYEEAVQMQNEYKEKDYDFGIDHSVIQQLCKAVRKNIPSSLGQDILKSFSKSNSGIINALSLIGGVILVSQHSDNGTVVSQKSEAIFDAFDFEGEGDISLDEMTICLLSVLRAVSVMTGRESEPTDQGMEELCLEAFGQFQLDAQDYIQKGQFAKWAASKVDATTSATGILKTFELLDKEARTRRNSRMTPRNGGAPYDGVDAKSQPVDAAEVQRLMSQTAPSRLPTPVAQGGGAGLPAAASSSSNFTYQAPSMAQLKAVATKYQQRLPQPGDPRYYRKAGAGGGEAPGLKVPVAMPAKARKASVHKSEPVFVSHKKEGPASSAGVYRPRAGLNPAAVYQAPTIAQLKAVGTKYVQRLPQAGDRRYYQKAAIQKQPAASASEFVFEMEAGQAGDESFNPATQSVVEEPVAAEVQKEMAKDRPVTAPSYKARAGLNPASVYQAPGMAQLKAVATKYQQRLPQPGDPRYYRKAGAGGGEAPGLKAPVAVPAKARKASVHKSEPVFVSHKKEGAASSAGACRPRAGVNPAAVYQAPSMAQLKAVGSKYALRLPQPGDRRFYQKAAVVAAATAAQPPRPPPPAVPKAREAQTAPFYKSMQQGASQNEGGGGGAGAAAGAGAQFAPNSPFFQQMRTYGGEGASEAPAPAPAKTQQEAGPAATAKTRPGLNRAAVYQAPGMAQLKAVATKYQQRLPQPGDPRYYRKAGAGGGEVPGLKAPVAVPAKARKASVHKSEPVFVSHKKEGAASSAGAYQPRAGVNPAAVYQAPTIAQLKAVGTKYVQRLPQAGDSRYYQKAAIQKQPAASASEFVFEMEAGQAGDESFNPATQSVVEEPMAAEVQKEMAKDRPVTAPSYKARAGLNPASVYQAPSMAQLKAVATKYQQRLPQPGDPRYYRKAGTGGGEVPGLKAPVAVPAKARKASVHKSEPVFVSHKKEGAASSAGAYQPRAGLNLAAVYQAPSIAQLKAVGSKYALRLPQPGDRRFYQKAKATTAARAAATTMVPVQAFADRKASLAPTLGPAPVAGATHVAAAAAALPSVVPLKPQPSRRDPFPRGLPVTANFCGLGWRSAKVLSVNANGTLNLLYTHGAKEVYVSTKVVGPPFSSFISHQVYTTMKPPLQLSSMRSTPSHIVSTPSSLTVAPLKNSCEPKSFRTPDGKVWYSSFVSHQTYQPPQRPSGPKSFQTPDGKVWYSSFVSHQTYQPPQKPSGPKSFRTPDGKVWYSSFVSHQTYQPPQKPSEPQSFRTPDGKVWYSSFVSHQTYCATKLPARSNEYTVGLPVTANFCGLGWRSAKVAEVNPNGTLNLLYTHGAKEVHVSKKAVRPPFSSFVSHQVYTTVKPLAVAPLKKSEEPKSFCTPDGKVWYSSFVSHQTYCASKLPACSNEYTVGLPVTANFCGLGWRSAKVVEVNPNGTLNLLYTHGAKEVHVSKKVVRPPFSSFVSHQVYTTVKPPLHWRMMRSTPSHIVSMPSSLNAAPLKLVR